MFIKKIFSSPPKFLTTGVILLIFIGTVLLSLPISRLESSDSIISDAFFTSTSATCVTGLVVKNTATHWSVFGKIIILTLIQIGGIGFMTIASFYFLFIGRKITLRERLLLREQFNVNQKGGIIRLTSSVLKYTFFIELMGACLLSIYFIPTYGFKTGLFFSVFHAISSFCNAGFDLFGTSLINFNSNIYVLTIINTLIILGGLGFTVINDIFFLRSKKRLSTHSKLVIRTSLVLIIFGFISFMLLEFNNNATLGKLNWFEKINASLFQSISPRTAGFQSINFQFINDGTILITIILMFIGASPGGTGGGIKTTTLGVLLATLTSVVRGSDDIEMFGRRLPGFIIFKAITIFLVSLMLVLSVAFTLILLQPNLRFLDLLFEVTSAFGTVGVSIGIVEKLNLFGKIALCTLMYLGRVGPLTVLYAINQKKKTSYIRLAEDDVIVG